LFNNNLSAEAIVTGIVHKNLNAKKNSSNEGASKSFFNQQRLKKIHKELRMISPNVCLTVRGNALLLL
jgi:hypothetical protein